MALRVVFVLVAVMLLCGCPPKSPKPETPPNPPPPQAALMAD
jgi:hypothetical protein